ncbi:polypeptide N-acetylgalactosaminyltransferase 17 isoform X2 [Danio rerio]|uniref:Polypeptide N-acetylgalactosaminyltransferase 17 isoform X2 n=1 Tax=Danio rerio TaxID=7955 RepID=A0AC58HC85_DANRE
MTTLVYCIKVCAQAFPERQFNFHRIVSMSWWQRASRPSTRREKPAFAEMRRQASSTPNSVLIMSVIHGLSLGMQMTVFNVGKEIAFQERAFQGVDVDPHCTDQRHRKSFGVGDTFPLVWFKHSNKHSSTMKQDFPLFTICVCVCVCVHVCVCVCMTVQLKGPLEEYVNKRYPGLIKIVRNQKREGLIRARIEGWKVATGEVTGFFDAHVEFTPAWAEPVLSRIKENHKRIILPSIDNIKDETFELERYENSGHGYNWELWCMYISPPKQWWDEGDTSAPIRTPAMIGCSFVVNREYFGDLGLLDAGMDVYGGENIELGIRVWLCGGSMEVLPCSRVAHIARTKKPYHSNIAFHTRRNALRVAEVWMDQYKSNVYLAWNLPMKNHGIDYGDVSERLALRKRLQCKSFDWYLDNIYPEMRRYNNTVFYGEIRNTNVTHLCVDQGIKENHTATLHPCHGWGPQLGRYTKEGYLFLGPLGSTGEDTRCVVDDKISSYPQLLNCEKVSSVRQKTWHFAQNESIISRATGRCLEVVPANVYFGYALILRSCTGQKWNIKNLMKQDQGQ